MKITLTDDELKTLARIKLNDKYAPPLPPGNLTKVYRSIGDDIRTMSDKSKRAFFKKLKVGAILTIMGVGTDAMAGWDGEGDFGRLLKLKGVSGAALNSWNEWAKSTFFKDDVNALAEFLAAGIATVVPTVPLSEAARLGRAGVTADLEK